MNVYTSWPPGPPGPRPSARPPGRRRRWVLAVVALAPAAVAIGSAVATIGGAVVPLAVGVLIGLLLMRPGRRRPTRARRPARPTRPARIPAYSTVKGKKR